jgi:uncharacterized protein (TIGR03118 family)
MGESQQMIQRGLNTMIIGRIALIVNLAFMLGTAAPSRADLYKVTNLITDDQSVNPAQLTDPKLVNSWGISHSAGSPFWVSENGTSVTTVYTVNPATNAVTKDTIGSPPDPSGGVVIPPIGTGTPTGQLFNTANATAFNKVSFLFVSEDGTISGWRPALGTTAEILQTALTANVYKGTTLDTMGGHSYLLAANFRAGTIDVLKGDTSAPDLTGKFVDPNLPSGFAPFNIQVLGGKIYVTYAVQDSAKHDDVAGPGNGIVTAFDLNGNFLGRIGTRGTLNSPWGLALAPSSFHNFAGDLLVGNFGDGTINVFSPNPGSPAFMGQLLGTDGKPLSIEGLWVLIPGNDGNGGSSKDIYFAAGPGGESHGLLGVLQSVPEPSSIVLGLIAPGWSQSTTAGSTRTREKRRWRWGV